jgi:outer membrane protein assembly factor BamA
MINVSLNNTFFSKEIELTNILNIGDAAGGDVYLAMGASLFTPLPKVKSPNLKGHLFVNAGSLRMLNHRK